MSGFQNCYFEKNCLIRSHISWICWYHAFYHIRPLPNTFIEAPRTQQLIVELDILWFGKLFIFSLRALVFTPEVMANKVASVSNVRACTLLSLIPCHWGLFLITLRHTHCKTSQLQDTPKWRQSIDLKVYFTLQLFSAVIKTSS